MVVSRAGEGEGLVSRVVLVVEEGNGMVFRGQG